MATQKAGRESDVPRTARHVNSILQNLRGEHFRRARNVQGVLVWSNGSTSHAHSQPTLPIDLIYPSPEPIISPSRPPGPSAPRSWRSSVATPTRLSPKIDVDGILPDTPGWRQLALSLLFSVDSISSHLESLRVCQTHPDPSVVPRLTLLCLQLIRAHCSRRDLAQVAPHIPPHLRRAFMRYAAVYAPLSQIELDALRQGATHIDTELVVVGPGNVLRASSFRKKNVDDDLDLNEASHNFTDRPVSETNDSDGWEDVTQMRETEPLALRSLVVLSSPLSAAVVLAFPMTIMHLALINIPLQIPLQRLPTVCPFLVFLDLSYNDWLASERGASILGDMNWRKLQNLKVVGLRRCAVTPGLLLELNRGRWEDIRVIR